MADWRRATHTLILGPVVAMTMAILFAGCGSVDGLRLVDAGGRSLREAQIGSSIHATAENLAPHRMYEFRLALGDTPARSRTDAVSFARVGADAEGNISPFILWYHTGVIGSAPRTPAAPRLPMFNYETFEEAEAALAAQRITVSVHLVEHDPTGRVAPFDLSVDPAVVERETVSLVRRSQAMVYPSDALGRLLNASEERTDHVFVSGRHFTPGEVVQVSLVPNRRRWQTGDRIRDVTGRGGASEPVLVRADTDGSFIVPVWSRDRQRRGAYDIVAQRDLASFSSSALAGMVSIRAVDLASYGADTGYILYSLYSGGAPLMDLAGRTLTGSPYFQFADSFADDGDTVWGAVDPTLVPSTHPGGKYAAYYVVAHRDVDGWDPSAGGAIDLVDLSGGIEVMPVKAGCINCSQIPIWNAPLAIGQFDVVVDFGPSPADTATTYVTDSEYQATVDFLDGAEQIGFVVAEDPHDRGSHLVGWSVYDEEDAFALLGTGGVLSPKDVDLRAVVMYPAKTAGEDKDVADGSFPLFVIQHGNEEVCKGAGTSHATCAPEDRIEHHRGFDDLLAILASQGIIAVSIDAYDLTGSTNPGWNVQSWIEERGELILKHIEAWSHWNDGGTPPAPFPDPFSDRFKGKVDLAKIAVSGHSRGGEAAVAAYLQNQASGAYPGLDSVSSIAPTAHETLSLPAGASYLLVLPAADDDVKDLSGLKTYDRAADGSTESGVYVYGANHYFFNKVWTDEFGDESPTDRDHYIDPEDQRRLGDAYLLAFTRVHLKGETVYEDMLRGNLVFPSTAGFEMFPMHHESSYHRMENGDGSGAATVDATAAISNTLPHDTNALRVGWSTDSGELIYKPALPWDTTGYEALSFRVAQTDSASNPEDSDQEFLVELMGGGHSKAVYAGRFGRIPVPYDHPSALADWHVMTTIRIPLRSFTINNSGVTLGAIDSVRFLFKNPTTGEINVDDVEFSR